MKLVLYERSDSRSRNSKQMLRRIAMLIIRTLFCLRFGFYFSFEKKKLCLLEETNIYFPAHVPNINTRYCAIIYYHYHYLVAIIVLVPA